MRALPRNHLPDEHLADLVQQFAGPIGLAQIDGLRTFGQLRRKFLAQLAQIIGQQSQHGLGIASQFFDQAGKLAHGTVGEHGLVKIHRQRGGRADLLDPHAAAAQVQGRGADVVDPLFRPGGDFLMRPAGTAGLDPHGQR